MYHEAQMDQQYEIFLALQDQGVYPNSITLRSSHFTFFFRPTPNVYTVLKILYSPCSLDDASNKYILQTENTHLHNPNQI
uniref:Uncharacterized protein n=1 Tax=Anguilla anguilla TaxID=7936 RepID=A0A0E9X2K8_ANGAN